MVNNEDLGDIQGFALTSFGKLRETTYLFLHFNDIALAKRFLGLLAPRLINGTFHGKAIVTETATVAFTYKGLEILGVPDACLNTFPDEFRRGMSHPTTAEKLGDVDTEYVKNSPSNWEFGASLDERVVIHVLLIISTVDGKGMDKYLSRLATSLFMCHVSLIALERGYVADDEKEHFGFRDGISSVEINGDHPTIAVGELLLGHLNAANYFTVSPILPEEFDSNSTLAKNLNPHRTGESRDFGKNGTFLVYRKLEQDVASFWNFFKNEAIHITGGPAETVRTMVWLAAKCVGRWPNGVVVGDSDEQPSCNSLTDDFLFAKGDSSGVGCPIGSHIRRANPRDYIIPCEPEESKQISARHRIARRGRRYGPALFDLTLLDKSEGGALNRTLLSLNNDGNSRGLHFVCLNASIGGQFEFIQQNWINNFHFNGVVNNPDPVAGARSKTARMSIMCKDGFRRTKSMPSFIQTRAGGYFFMPSFRALRWLASAPMTPA